MSFRESQGYRTLLVIMSIVCLGGAGYLAYRLFVNPTKPDKLIAEGNAAYARGTQAFEAKKFAEAQQKFDEARVLADKAIILVDARAVTPEGQTPEARVELNDLAGNALWLKARAIRDREYAKAAADGKPIEDATDTTTKEKYRNFWMIPDPEVRRDALVALGAASGRLDQNPDVLKEALRSEIVFSPLNWPQVEKLCRAIIKLNPKDARAQYFLARYEYEQPGVAYDKKVPDRVTAASEHLAAAKTGTPPQPFWRVAFLEAQILGWRANDAARRKGGDVAKFEAPLRNMLFDATDGVLVKASAGEHLEALSKLDVDGILGLLLMSADLAINDMSKPTGDRGRLLVVARSAGSAGQKIAEHPAGKAHADEVGAALLSIAAMFHQFADPSHPDWKAFFDRSKALATGEGGADKPAVAAAYGRFVMRDVAAAAQKGDRTRRDAVLAEGIKVLSKATVGGPGRNPNDYEEVHAQLAVLKLLGGEKPEAIESHLTALRDSKNPRVKAQAKLLDAAAAERSGRLDKARQILEPFSTNPDPKNPDLTFRANVMLVNIYMAMGKPAEALGPMQQVEEGYKAFDRLGPEAQAWASEYVRGPEEIAQLLAIANLDAAANLVQNHRKDKPNAPIPPALIASHEKLAADQFKKIKGPSAADLGARLALARYLALTDRRDQALAGLASLARDYPDRVEVLRTETALILMPRFGSTTGAPPTADQIKAADERIQKFLQTSPGSQAGKLFWAEWLSKTGRADQALSYLKDPVNFPGPRDEAVDRMLAVVLAQTGQAAEAQKILSQVTRDPAVEIALLQMAGAETARDQIKEAMTRYQSNGLLRLYEASLKLNDKNYEEGIRGFAAATEFTQVRAAARSGLLRGFIVYNAADPFKARELAHKMALETPDEPGPYLASAISAMTLDDIGRETDNWPNQKTMGAALNRWEAAATKAGAGRVQIAFTKAELWAAVVRKDMARQEANRALLAEPEHVPSLVLLAGSYLSSADKAEIAKAKEYIATLKTVASDAPATIALDAMSYEIDGDLAGAAKVYKIALERNAGLAFAYPTLLALLEKLNDSAGQADLLKKWRETLPSDPSLASESIRVLCKANKVAEAKGIADQFIADQTAAITKRVETIKPPEGAQAEKWPARKQEIIQGAELSAVLLTASGFFRAAQYDEAAARIKRVLEKKPDAEVAQLMLGDICVATAKWDEAIKVYEEVVRKNERHDVAGNNLAWILATQKNNPRRALEVVQEVRKGRGTTPVGAERLSAAFLDTIGVIYLKLGQSEKYPEMRETFEAAVRRYPNDPRMHLYLGEAQAALGDSSRAVGSFDTAIRSAAPGVRNGLNDKERAEALAAATAAKKRLTGGR